MLYNIISGDNPDTFERKRLMRRIIELQLFADGEGSAAGTSEGASGEATVDAAQTGEATVDAAQEGTESKKSFDELIKGDYKADFEGKVHKIIGSKTATIKSMQETMDKMNPILDMVAAKYGLDAGDYEALAEAINNDTTMYEQEAVERGMTVEQLKVLKQVELENQNLKRMMERDRKQTETDRIYNEWMEQSEALQETYPDFDFVTECKNSDFADLLRSGIDVRTAYEVIHKDEIIQGAMASAVAKTKEKVTNDILANGNRANENGSSSAAGVVYKRDVNSLTKKDLLEIEKRVMRGEKVTFS